MEVTFLEFFRIFASIHNPKRYVLEEQDSGCLYFRFEGAVVMQYYPDNTYFTLYGDVVRDGLHHRIAEAAIQMGVSFRYVPESPYHARTKGSSTNA